MVQDCVHQPHQCRAGVVAVVALALKCGVSIVSMVCKEFQSCAKISSRTVYTSVSCHISVIPCAPVVSLLLAHGLRDQLPHLCEEMHSLLDGVASSIDRLETLSRTIC